MVVDFKNIEGGANYIETEGEYSFTVEKVEFREVNEKKNHRFTCKTIDGELSTLTLWLTEKSMWRYKNFLKVLGYDVENLSGDIEVIANSTIGKQFVGSVLEGEKYDPLTDTKEKTGYFAIEKFKPMP